MEQKIKDLVNDYNKHTFDILPSTVLTVMAWMAAQALIEEFMKSFAPGVQRWQLAAIELFIASFGLWFVTRRKKEEMTPEVKTEVA